MKIYQAPLWLGITAVNIYMQKSVDGKKFDLTPSHWKRNYSGGKNVNRANENGKALGISGEKTARIGTGRQFAGRPRTRLLPYSGSTWIL